MEKWGYRKIASYLNLQGIKTKKRSIGPLMLSKRF
ncbi:hypothetical protein MOF52_07335 [Bacillus inaquosorum]|nr:hypothetical protein [Bacillus inaquosorum]MCY9407843.1 hypothetical protein [Bacillus inaquosorum]MCY9415519.1 hypothetical protein [Bacillus inaquosorum]